MNIKAFLFDDDRGVSPVIGVILMVAITVILAAVIAAFVLGLGDTNSTAPNVNFEYDYDSADDNVTVTMTSGDTFDPARISVTGDNLGDAQLDENPTTQVITLGNEVGGDNVGSELTDLNSTRSGNAFTESYSSGDTFSSGDSFTVTTAGDGFELDIIFTSEDGGTSSRIGGTTGPDA